VQSLKIDSKTTEITPELFEAASGKDIKQSKLRVVLVGPPKPPSPVPEGVEEEASPMRVSHHIRPLCSAVMLGARQESRYVCNSSCRLDSPAVQSRVKELCINWSVWTVSKVFLAVRMAYAPSRNQPFKRL